MFLLVCNYMLLCISRKDMDKKNTRLSTFTLFTQIKGTATFVAILFFTMVEKSAYV